MQSYDNLRNTFGTQGYPVPPPTSRQALVADGLMETNQNLISDVQFEAVDRSRVGQQPLVKV